MTTIRKISVNHSNTYSRRHALHDQLRSVEDKLNNHFGTKDWSVVQTDDNDKVWDSFYSRCICWTRIQTGDFWNQETKRVYAWRAFYGVTRLDQRNNPDNGNPNNPNNEDRSNKLGTELGTALGVGLGVPLGIVLGILELTTTTTVATTTTIGKRKLHNNIKLSF